MSEWQDRIEHRLEIIETKLDRHLEQAAAQNSDLGWVKGYIKLSVVLFITIFGAMTPVIINFFIK